MDEEIEVVNPNVKYFKVYKFGKYSFSSIELKHLTIALIMITLTLMAANSGGIKEFGLLNFIVINILTIGLAFLLHEFGHKLTAQHFGFISEFRVDIPMLFISFFFALFLHVVFLAPGAVMIFTNRITDRENGIISLAGPFVNLVLAIIFLILLFFISSNGILGYLFYVGAWVNLYIGIFNMLPFWILDGKKILKWNSYIYIFFVILFLGLIYLMKFY